MPRQRENERRRCAALQACAALLSALDDEGRKWVMASLQSYPWPTWWDDLGARQEAALAFMATVINNFLPPGERQAMLDELERRFPMPADGKAA